MARAFNLTWAPSAVLARWIGQVGIRSGFCNGGGDGSTYAVRQFEDIYSDGLMPGVYIDFLNAYVPSNPNASETNGASDGHVRCAIEHPAGTFTQVKFSGGALGTMPPGVIVRSDLCPVVLPAGVTRVKLHMQMHNMPSYTQANGKRRDPTHGDAIQLTSTDLTMTGGETDDPTFTRSFLTNAIVGSTTSHSAGCVGDSIDAGENDTLMDGLGLRGVLCRFYGARMPCINLGIASDQTTAFAASHALRIATAKNCTFIASNYGVNDRADTVSNVLAAYQTIAAACGAWPFVQGTVTPSSSGAWTNSNHSDQTLNGTYTSFIEGVNSALRAGLSGVTTNEIAPAFENGTTGYWLAFDDILQALTDDGLHPNNNGYVRPSGLWLPSAAPTYMAGYG